MKLAAAWVFLLASSLALAQEPQKPPAAPEKKAEPVISIEKSDKPAPCVIKPVMTDDELRACGARPPK